MAMAKQTDKGYWRWEFLRRNEDYRKDFQRFGNTRQAPKNMLFKWGFLFHLKDPALPLGENSLLNPITNLSQQSFHITVDRKTSCFLFPPGTELKRKNGRKYKTTFWNVYRKDENVIEKLTTQNCPRFLTVTIGIDPHHSPFQRASQVKTAKLFFESYLNEILKAQKAVFKERSIERPRLDLFQDYIRVYDLKKNIPTMTWTEIAKKIFPHQVCISESPHRHFLKEVVAPSARDTVRKYWKQANMMINKERWRGI
jgi:hypothetical protein